MGNGSRTVRDRSRTIRKRVVWTRPKTGSKGITGRANGSGIKSASVKRFANVFATRFERHVTATDVTNYLSQRLGRGMKLTVEAVPTKFDSYSSFHIICDCSDTSVFMDSSPSGRRTYLSDGGGINVAPLPLSLGFLGRMVMLVFPFPSL